MSFAMIAGITGGLLSLIAYIPRAVQKVRNPTRSSNTWLIWTLSNFLIFLSLYSLGVRTTIWIPLAYFIGSAIITILSFNHRAEGWTTLHKWLLGIALLSGVRWWYFADPIVTQAFNVLIYLAGHIMIIRDKLKSQRKESWVVPWALYFSGALINLFAITDWSPQVSSYPIILVIMNGTVFAITLRNYFRNAKIQADLSGLE